MKVLGIIPARGGSKGVKRKNIRLVGGQPLISWSISAAQNASQVTHYYVNTEDEEIANISESYGAKVMERPMQLAQDKTPMIPVLQYVCEQAESIHGEFDTIVLIQPTAPMRTEEDIDSALVRFHQAASVSSMVSVYQVDDCHPSRMYTIENGRLEKIYVEPAGSLRQDLEPVFHRNGALYICHRDLLMNEGKLTCSEPIPYIMSKHRSVNIDDEQDLEIADFLMAKVLKKYKSY